MLIGGRKSLLMIYLTQLTSLGGFSDIMIVASFAFYFAVFSGSWLFFFFSERSSEFQSSKDYKKHLCNQLPLSVALGGGHQCGPIWELDSNLVHNCGLASNPGWQPLICWLAFARGKEEWIISNLRLRSAIIAQIHVLLIVFKIYYLKRGII